VLAKRYLKGARAEPVLVICPGMRAIQSPMIRITTSIAIDENELEERLSIRRVGDRAGRTSNKVASAVQLRFDVAPLAVAPRCRADPARAAGPASG